MPDETDNRQELEAHAVTNQELDAPLLMDSSNNTTTTPHNSIYNPDLSAEHPRDDGTARPGDDGAAKPGDEILEQPGHEDAEQPGDDGTAHRDDEDAEQLGHENAEQLVEQREECPVCLEMNADESLYQCSHLVCCGCAMHLLVNANPCPLCRAALRPEKLVSPYGESASRLTVFTKLLYLSVAPTTDGAISIHPNY